MLLSLLVAALVIAIAIAIAFAFVKERLKEPDEVRTDVQFPARQEEGARAYGSPLLCPLPCRPRRRALTAP
ncbi:hypothetical protein ACF05L_01970 [Streptomyces bobili]|uniref:hypothetical protein n=1 Tax=Streptomyces bobili TaxID=67280 RepID=UPI0036F90422